MAAARPPRAASTPPSPSHVPVRPSPPAHRRLNARTVFTVLAGLLTAVAGAVYLGAAEAPTVRVLAAGQQIAAGSRVAPEALKVVELSAGEEVIAGLVPATDQQRIAGWVAADTLAPGELIATADLQEPGQAGGQRALALPVGADRAVGGQLAVGDRVDVIAVIEGRARYVARDLQVVAVGTAGAAAGPLTMSRDFQVTVATDGKTALDLAAALAAGDVRLVRSTAASPAGEIGSEGG